MARIIQFGNRTPKKYYSNPKIENPEAVSLAHIEMWAREVCGLDLSGVPQVGQEVFAQQTDPDAAPVLAYVTTDAIRKGLIIQKINEPQLDTLWQQDEAEEYVTTVQVSPDSNLLQALSEITRIWDAHSKDDAPDWMAHNDEASALAILVADHYKITDIREMQP